MNNTTVLSSVVARAAELDLINEAEEKAALLEIQQMTNLKSPTVKTPNPSVTKHDPSRIERLAVYLGQNESLYLDRSGCSEIATPLAGESESNYRMRVDAIFRVRRAIMLADAIDAMTK